MNTNTTSPTNVTRTIAGHEITLPPGRYIASRPMTSRKNQRFPITIRNEANEIVLTLYPMTFIKANEFINAFNNGPISFDGRNW